ncbi:MAG: replication factor C large subunit [Candidatus Pacearchaeota archaeon]
MVKAEVWNEKYRPESFEDIKGQNEAVYKIKNFVESFPQKKKAMILHGSPGAGKTSMAHVIASETGSEIFELNASDLRNKNKLKEVLKPAMEQQSLVNRQKLILVDEANGITGTDRGGVQELARLVDESEYPVIITVNDPWIKKLSPLRKKCEMVQMKQPSSETINKILNGIMERENFHLPEAIVDKIAKNSRGDIRAAVNDLQSASQLENPSDVLFDERNKDESIFNALQKIYKEEPSKDSLWVFDSVDMDLDEIKLWIEKNTPYEYQGRGLEKSFDLISKADIFKGRIHKRQHWRFLVYINALLSYGIASIKEEPKEDFTKYKKPTRVLKIWMHNQKMAKKKTIAEKYASQTHISSKKAMREFPLIKQIVSSDEKMQQRLNLDKDELEFLKQ